VWTPFQTHYFSENLVAPGIEPGTSGCVARNSDHQTTEAAYSREESYYEFIAHYKCINPEYEIVVTQIKKSLQSNEENI
jgi:hypothetical protein